MNPDSRNNASDDAIIEFIGETEKKSVSPAATSACILFFSASNAVGIFRGKVDTDAKFSS